MARFVNPPLGSPKFRSKTEPQRQRIEQALEVISSLGVSPDETPRSLERMALAFLAIADLDPNSEWRSAKSVEKYALTTREIIPWINKNFGETISSGSYDDVRRKDLKMLHIAGIAVQSDPSAARNSPTRKWGLNNDAGGVIRCFGTRKFKLEAARWVSKVGSISDQLSAARVLNIQNVDLGDEDIKLGPGEHNAIIKAVIEEFLPRYGHKAEVLYVGDADSRHLLLRKDRLSDIGFFDLTGGEILPDVIAFSTSRNWLYIIEAVHSSGTVSPIRRLELSRLLAGCRVPIVYVTAFLSKEKFRSFVADVAWETEVWIASEPDHLVHFNGDKFLGPYGAQTEERPNS